MRNFYEKIIDHSKSIFIIFMLIAVGGMFCKPLVEVNYDMNDYLPQDTKSTVALNKMHEEYSGGIPNARVMLNDVSIPEALQYKEKIKNVDGVEEITWLDNVINIAQPLDSFDNQIVETYYKNRHALFTITIEEEKNIEAVNHIKKIIGKDNAITGSAVSTAVATESTVSQIQKISVFAVLFVLFVLILTTHSWIEPFIILFGLGVAIIINAGSNIIFGEISFVTNAAGSILQLAVSLDYSVFLIHRFHECLDNTKDTKLAMVDALCMSTSSILSSGLTTVIGFAALCLMRFEIGADLGLALAKGIGISLLTVFVFMPSVILKTHHWVEKTYHHSLMPSFEKFGHFVCHMMIPMACIFVLVIVPSYLASNSNDFYYGSSRIFGTETRLGSDTEKVENVFGKNDTYVLIVPKDDLAKQQKLSDELHTIPEVKSILSYVDTVGAQIPEQYLDEDTLSQLNSANYSRMVITVESDYEGEETFELVNQIRGISKKYFDDWYLAGEGVSTRDLMATVTADMANVNFVAIMAVFIVLVITMKSLIIPVILVLSIETAIWINLSIPYFTDQTIFYIAYLIISSIQLGATVDYAILFTERYKEMRSLYPRKEAVVQTISAVTTSILTSGSCLTVIGFLLGYISTHGLLSQLGFFLGKGTLCSLIIVLFVLPALLYLFDRFIIKNKGGKINEKS
ncbi:MAG: RND family transporter [Faecalibacillus sp.]